MFHIGPKQASILPVKLKGGGADVPLFETIKTNAGTRRVQCYLFEKKISWAQIIQECIIQRKMAKKNSAADGVFRRFRRRFFAVP